MRIFTAGLITETNTFAPWPTGRRGFEEAGDFRDGATSSRLASLWREPAEKDRHDFVESLFAHAEPSGPTVQSVYEGYRDEILRDLRDKGPFDVILLLLHGAMVSTECDDCEGDILTRVRAIVGADAIIGLELDPHCHLTPLMVEKANAIVLFKEYPHIDYLERGRELYDICVRAARGACRPVSRLFDCRMVGFYPTTTEPMAGLVARMHEAERRPKVLSVSFAHGFPWGDTPETGSKVLAITDDDPSLAEQVASEIGLAIYGARDALLPRYPGIQAALESARTLGGRIVLADTADNAGGGAPSDNVSLLRAMLEAKVQAAAFGSIWDPVAASVCAEAGVGTRLPLRLGGKCGLASGESLDAIVAVKAVRADHDQQGLGPRAPMGLSAWIEIGGIDVVVNSIRTQTFAPDAFTGLGIDLDAKKLIAVKSSWHFQANFSAIADHIIAVSTPGAIQMDFAGIDYRKKRDQKFFPRTHDPLGAG